MKVTSENDVTPSASAEEALDFDDVTLRGDIQQLTRNYLLNQSAGVQIS